MFLGIPDSLSNQRIAKMSKWIPRQRPGLEVSRDEEGKVILSDSSGSILMYLNNTALVVWQLCDGFRTEDELIDVLRGCFPEADDQLNEDVAAALKRFASHGVLEFS